MRDPFHTRLARRAVSIPAVGLACALATALWPGLLLGGALVDLLLSRPRWATSRLLLWAPAALWLEVLGVLALFGVFLLTPFAPARRARLTWPVQRGYAGAHFGLVRACFAVTLEVEGEALAMPGPVVVLIRHASIVDTLLPAVVLANRHHLELRYVLKKELLWQPCLDLAGHWLPNAFAARDGADTDGDVKAVAGLKAGLGAREGVLVYPEGTRFTTAKRERALTRLEGAARDRALALRHVLPIRPGGVLALLEAEPFCDVLFVGHHGLEGLVQVADVLSGRLVGQRITVKLWRERAADIPPEREARLQWVSERWQRLDDWLEERERTTLTRSP